MLEVLRLSASRTDAMGRFWGVVQGGGVAEFQGLNSVGLQEVVQGVVACREG